jgi:phosphoglycolate phosphatase
MHLILFDVDGTLIGGIGMGRLALERAFAEVYQVDAVGHPRLKQVNFAGSHDPKIIADMADALGLDGGVVSPRLAELQESYVRHLRVTVTENDTHAPCPGVEDLLPRLHAHPRLALGLLTGNIEAGARIKIDAFRFNRFCDFGGFGGDGEDRAAMARRARDRAETVTGRRFPPERVLVVGDTIFDVASGRANGFLTVGVGSGSNTVERLRDAGATAVFETLAPEHGFEAWLAEQWDLERKGDPV